MHEIQFVTALDFAIILTKSRLNEVLSFYRGFLLRSCFNIQSGTLE